MNAMEKMQRDLKQCGPAERPEKIAEFAPVVQAHVDAAKAQKEGDRERWARVHAETHGEQVDKGVVPYRDVQAARLSLWHLVIGVLVTAAGSGVGIYLWRITMNLRSPIREVAGVVTAAVGAGVFSMWLRRGASRAELIQPRIDGAHRALRRALIAGGVLALAFAYIRASASAPSWLLRSSTAVLEYPVLEAAGGFIALWFLHGTANRIQADYLRVCLSLEAWTKFQSSLTGGGPTGPA